MTSGHFSTRDQRSGFALVAAIFAIVIIGAIVTGGYMVASRQLRIGVSGLAASAGLYSAEAGLHASLAGWEPSVAAELSPGATIPLVSGQLSSGDQYDVWLTRLDAAQDSQTAYYLIRSVGLARGAHGGRRHVGLLLRVHYPDSICCDAALTANGEVNLLDAAAISGFDRAPVGWDEADVCPATGGHDRPGAILASGAVVTTEDPAQLEGDPPLVVLDPAGSEFLAEARASYGDLEERADNSLPGGLIVDNVQPAVTVGGECRRDAALNWGAPRDPEHPCFEYFPITHAAGDLTIESDGAGQGFLLVDGDLVIRGGFEFFGSVFVLGRLELGGDVSIHGGVVVLGETEGAVRLTENARVESSSCALGRALEGSNLVRPRPLAQRAWLEIFK